MDLTSIIGLIFLLIVAIMFLYVFSIMQKNQKTPVNKKSKERIEQKQSEQYHEEAKQRLQQQKIDEIRKLLQKQNDLIPIKEKIRTWKNQSYDVEELEKMIEEMK